MMQLLLPLGLLGLLGVLGLILIYIIRPNYLTKHVSSTYVWKLSLKYKKKKLPTSKIRNLLLFICQILILVSMALILAEPAIVYETAGEDNELIAVIDSSMSMYTGSEESNRFSRAVDQTIAESNRVLDAGGSPSSLPTIRPTICASGSLRAAAVSSLLPLTDSKRTPRVARCSVLTALPIWTKRCS